MAETPPVETERERKPRESTPMQSDVLQRNVNALFDRVSALERFKAEQAQFVFQTVAVVITLLALTIGIPVAVISRFQLGSGMTEAIATGALTGIGVILAIWLVLWYLLHFGRRP